MFDEAIHDPLDNNTYCSTYCFFIYIYYSMKHCNNKFLELEVNEKLTPSSFDNAYKFILVL